MLSHIYRSFPYLFFFFFNDTATTEIYTLSLHDALPISAGRLEWQAPTSVSVPEIEPEPQDLAECLADRKSTRLNSSHGYISYAVFCLKKKKQNSRSTRYYTRKAPDNQCLTNGQPPKSTS